MPDPKVSQPQQETIKDAAEDAQAGLEQAQEELRREPASDDQRSVLRVVAEKLALVAEIVSKGTTLDIRESDIRRWTQEFEENGKWLERIVDAVIDAIETIIGTIVDVFESIGEKIVSIVERITGSAEVAMAADGSWRVTGTAQATLLAGGALPGVDAGQELATAEGEFRMTLVPLGEVSEDVVSYYRVTSFKSGAGFVALGQVAQIEDVKEGLADDGLSIVEVTPEGAVSGEIHTTFVSPSLRTDEMGPVRGKTRFQGQLSADRTSLDFTGESWEIFSMDRLG